jgi:hypothetical protein
LTKEYNKDLLNYSSSAWNTYNDAIKRNIPVVPEMIRNTITNKSTHTLTLLEAIQFQINNLTARVGHDISANTVKKYLTVGKKIKQFISVHLKKEDLFLYELNRQLISEFDSFMRITGKLKQNAIIKNMQQLRHVIRICLDNDWMEKDPFTNYSFKMNDTERGYLTMNEVNIILRGAIRTLFENYNSGFHLFHLKRLNEFEITEQKFAHLIGRARIYNYLPAACKKDIPQLLFGDSQINTVCRELYANVDGYINNINLWKLYNLFTSANKSSYIDSFLERSVNAYEFTEQICFALENRTTCWYLN